jgi:hypothetical protein
MTTQARKTWGLLIVESHLSCVSNAEIVLETRLFPSLNCWCIWGDFLYLFVSGSFFMLCCCLCCFYSWTVSEAADPIPLNLWSGASVSTMCVYAWKLIVEKFVCRSHCESHWIACNWRYYCQQRLQEEEGEPIHWQSSAYFFVSMFIIAQSLLEKKFHGVVQLAEVLN